MDALQFSELMEAAQGFVSRDSFAIEYEVILIWVTYIPVFLDPIIYFSFLTEYR